VPIVPGRTPVGPWSLRGSARTIQSSGVQRVRIASRHKPGEGLWVIFRQNLDGSEPTTTCPTSQRIFPWRPGLCRWLLFAHRNGVGDGKGRRGLGRLRDPELGRLASTHRHLPAGRSPPAGFVAGMGERTTPIARQQVYRVVREMLPRERLGPDDSLLWLEDARQRNKRGLRSHERRRSTHHEVRMELQPGTRRNSDNRGHFKIPFPPRSNEGEFPSAPAFPSIAQGSHPQVAT